MYFSYNIYIYIYICQLTILIPNKIQFLQVLRPNKRSKMWKRHEEHMPCWKEDKSMYAPGWVLGGLGAYGKCCDALVIGL